MYNSDSLTHPEEGQNAHFRSGIALAREQAVAGARSLAGVVFSGPLWSWEVTSRTVDQGDLAVGVGC